MHEDVSLFWIIVIVVAGLCAAFGALLLAKHRQATLGFVRDRFKLGSAYGLGLTLSLGIVGVAFWGFTEIVELWSGTSTLDALDRQVNAWATSLHAAWLSSVMTVVTYLGSGWVTVPLVAVAALVLYRRGARWAVATLFVAYGAGEALVYLLKYVFDRARPSSIVVHAAGASFPSGHSFTALVVYGFFVYLLWHRSVRPLGRWAGTFGLVLVVLLVGFSRIYLHAHYFTDVTGGFVLGLAWLAAGVALTQVVRSHAHSQTSSGGGASDA